MYPTDDQIKDLHHKYAPSIKAFNIVFSHCEIIAEIVKQIISENKLELDQELAVKGALLHDIGAYKLVDKEGNFDETNYIKHGIIGYEILLSENLSESLCRIAKCHTGLGLTKEYIVASRLPLPAENLTAESIEEKIVMYADKFHSKNPKFNTYEEYCQTAAKFGEDNVQKFHDLTELFGKPDLNLIIKNYRSNILDWHLAHLV